MNKKINFYLWVVIAALICSAFPLSVFAGETPKDLYIQKVQFLIDNEVQFYNSKNANLYSPSATITRAEYIKYIVQAMKLKIITGSSYADADKDPYKNYITTAYKNEWLPSSYFGRSIQPDKKITKYEAALITANALNMKSFESGEPYYADYSGSEFNTLSNAYIIFGEYGKDGKYNIYPENAMTYGGAADILVRTIKYAASPAEYRSEAIIGYAKKVPVDSERRFFDLLWAMSSQRMEEVYVYFNMPNNEIEETFQDFTVKKPEMNIMSFKLLTTGNPKDEAIVCLSYIPLPVTVGEEMEITYNAARDIVDTLTENSMKDKEKLAAIYNYLIKNCVYDYEARDNGKIGGAYTAYNVFFKKKAVCQGISAAFNLLAQAAGIKSFSVYGEAPVSGENHLWNAVYIDGEIYFCDATWDIDETPDSKKTIKYFLKTKKEMEELDYKFTAEQIMVEYFYR